MEVKPYSNDKGTKKEQVIRMFNQIAPRYDFLNRILSFGIDKIWRKRLVKLAARSKASVILDVATGTGDLALALTKNEPAIIYAVDISTKMLQLAEKKVQKKNLQNTIILKEADSESLPFENNTIFFEFGLVARINERSFRRSTNQKETNPVERIICYCKRMPICKIID